MERDKPQTRCGVEPKANIKRVWSHAYKQDLDAAHAYPYTLDTAAQLAAQDSKVLFS